MSNVAVGRFDQAAIGPETIGHLVDLLERFDIAARNPKERQTDEFPGDLVGVDPIALNGIAGATDASSHSVRFIPLRIPAATLNVWFN
jgi:hypothetical protein